MVLHLPDPKDEGGFSPGHDRLKPAWIKPPDTRDRRAGLESIPRSDQESPAQGGSRHRRSNHQRCSHLTTKRSRTENRVEHSIWSTLNRINMEREPKDPTWWILKIKEAQILSSPRQKIFRTVPQSRLSSSGSRPALSVSPVPQLLLEGDEHTASI